MGFIQRSLSSLQTGHVPQFAAAYGAGSWVVLEVLDQLIGNEILPQWIYPLALTLVVTLAPGVLVVAWFHGEKGAQEVPLIEKWILAGVATLAVASTSMVYRATATVLPVVGGPPVNRVAVLYFVDRSPQGEFGYVADGLTEGLIRQLSRVQGLDVVSRNGVAPYRNADVTPYHVGRALGVGSIIRGSLEPEGDGLRISTELLEGSSGASVDRASFVLPASNILAVVDSASQDVSRLLRGWIGRELRARSLREATSSNQAWALVQRGERLRKDAAASLDDAEAERLFGEADSILAVAEALDADWVEPIVLRATIAYRRSREADEPFGLIDDAVIHADRALALEPDYPEALEVRGTAQYFRWLIGGVHDPAEAEALFARARQDLERAVDIDATLASAFSTLSHLYYEVGDVSSVVLAARSAYEADAYLELANEVLHRLFFGHHDLEQLDLAGQRCDQGSRRFPDDFRFKECQLMMMTTTEREPDVDQAWRLLDQLETRTSDGVQQRRARMLVGGVIARAALADSARSVLLSARAAPSVDPDGELLLFEARMRSLLGENGEAIELLKRYVATNPGHFGRGSSVTWWWRDLRNDPQFQELERLAQ